MHSAVDAIKLAAGVIITLLVIAIGFSLYRNGKQSSQNANSQISEMNTELNESKYTTLDGTSLTGQEVLSSISEFSGDELCICVKTKTNTSGMYFNYTSEKLTQAVTNAKGESSNSDILNKARTKSNANYINPTAHFLATITRDKNSTIVLLTFEQQ